MRTRVPDDQPLAQAAAIVLVEGVSDQAALATLAARHGRDLNGEGVFVVPMGGATNIGHFLEVFGPRGFGVRLAGLCDEGEEPAFRRGLERAGLAPGPGRSGLERLGFFVCVADLEDELIRALGVAATERLIQEQGELGSFRTFANQPAQRARPREQQLRRFLGTAPAGRSATARCSPQRSTSPRSPARWPASSPTSDAMCDPTRAHVLPDRESPAAGRLIVASPLLDDLHPVTV